MRAVTIYDSTSGLIRANVSYPKFLDIPLAPGEAIYEGSVDPATYIIDVGADPIAPIAKSPVVASVSKSSLAPNEVFTFSVDQVSFVRVTDDVGDQLIRQWVPLGDHEAKIEDVGVYKIRVSSPLHTPVTLTVTVA